MSEQSIAEDSTINTIIRDQIEKHSGIHKHLLTLYREYEGKVPIKQRKLSDTNKINNKLANDYRGSIVDSFAGYLFGNPISYELLQGDLPDAIHERYEEEFRTFRTINDIPDLDAETGKMMGITGRAARLLYVDPEGDIRVVNIDPWQTAFFTDSRTGLPQYAMRYYTMTRSTGDGEETFIRVEWYDEQKVSYFEENKAGFYQFKEERPHGFDGVPLIEFINNDEKQGDFEKVDSLIDAQDRILSDVQNEIEEFRNAYMIFKGAEIDVETVQAARQTGAFNVPDDGDVQYLTKNLNPEFVEKHKDTINQNIYKFSQSIDMGDDKFSGGAQSGESRKYKLIMMENKAIMKERKFSKALRQMFKVLASAWAKRQINIDYTDIRWNFTRNLPVELNYEAEVLQKLYGITADRTALAQMSFIDDPDEEIQRKKEEQEVYIDLDEGQDE